MTTLKDAVSNASRQIKNDFRGGVNQVKQGLKNEVSNAVNNVTGSVRAIANAPLQAGVSGIQNAVSSALKGDLGSATRSIMDIPKNAIGATMNAAQNALTSLGVTAGSLIKNTVGSALNRVGLGGLLGSSSSNRDVSGFSSSGSGGANYGNALEGALARSDPVLNFNWYCDLPVIEVNGKMTSLPWYFVEEATVPFRTYAPRNVYRDGRDRIYAGKYSVDSLRLGFYLDTDNKTMSYLKAWDNAIMAPFSRTDANTKGGGYNVPSMYMKDIYIYILDVTKNAIIQLIYTECWPQNVDGLTLGSASSDRLIGQVTFNVGDVFMDIMNVTPQITTALQGKMVRPDYNMKVTESYDLNRPGSVPSVPEVQTMPVYEPTPVEIFPVVP